VSWPSSLGLDPVMDGSDRTVLWFMSRSVMYCARQYKAMSGEEQQWPPLSVWVKYSLQRQWCFKMDECVRV